MTAARPETVPRTAFLVIALVACAMLMYEIVLTRISALRLLFHFSFLVISNCLLGVGAAGTVITLYRDRWQAEPRLYIWRACVLFASSVLGSYAFLLTFDLPTELRLDQLEHFLRFSIFNFVAAVPFFLAGGVIGMVLTFYAQRVNRLYASDLLGAGLGCVLCPFAIESFGAGGTILLIGLMAVVSTVLAAPAGRLRGALVAGVPAAGLLLAGIPVFDAWMPVPTKAFAGLSPDDRLALEGTIEDSRWSAGSRIDLHRVAPNSRRIFGMGRRRPAIPIPEQMYINQDGSAGTYITNFSDHPEALELLRHSLYSAAVSLKREPRVFVIGVGGGHDLWAAKAAGASAIRGVELNRPILDIHRSVLSRYSRALLEGPNVELVHGEGRSRLMVERDRYDVVQMTGIDTWTSLASGAYILAENYLYTREAIEDLVARLAPGGILQITRFALDMEILRLLANVDAALSGRSDAPIERSVAVLRAGLLGAVLVKRGAFAPREVAGLQRFARASGIDVVHLPGRPAPPDGRTNLPAHFLTSSDKAAFIRDFPRDISPTTDDRPYFFNYTKWSDPLRAREHVWEPTSISQGNPLFLLAQLGVSAVLAVSLIVVPLAGRATVRPDYAGRFLAYFVGLGAGFIAIEVALIQKLTLFLGHPIYSITVTLASILVFTGLGSLVSERWFERRPQRAWLVAVGVALAIALFLLRFPAVIDAGIGWPLGLRIAITAAALAPIAFLLGVPFAYGIRQLTRLNPTLIPWAWAVNGAFSVVGSLLTVIVSMNFGFTTVLVLAAGVYALAFAALPRSGA